MLLYIPFKYIINNLFIDIQRRTAMGTNINNSWEMIQQGVKDTERLIGQRDYNASMIKARQTLEFMVTLLTERAGIADTSDLKDMIDTLYQHRWINKTTCEHYHKIRIIGNKAVHEGDANAYNANQAYHMLSQEVYTFANDYRNAQRGTRPAQSSRATQSGARQAQGSRQPQNARRQAPSSSTRSRRRQPQKRAGFTVYDLLKLLVPVLCIILLFCVVKLVKPSKDPKETTAPTTTEEVTTAEVPTTPETEAPTQAPVVYKTTSVLNVRPQPNTEDARIGQLEAGATVEFVRTHDDKWAVIMYNGQEAYVASEYLTTQ